MHKRLSIILVRLATKLWPENPAVKLYFIRLRNQHTIDKLFNDYIKRQEIKDASK